MNPVVQSHELHVAVGVVRGAAGEVLIARRHDHLHQGGLWEFPGGKVEAGESTLEALDRELHEELGIRVLRGEPLLQVRHAYADRSVLLDTFEVLEFSGTPQGREGQPIIWVAADDLSSFEFPAANRPILTAARLPDRYAILDNPAEQDLSDCLHNLGASGVRVVQLRAKALSDGAYRSLATAALKIAADLGVSLLLNHDPQLALELGAQGVHLDSARLRRLDERPEGSHFWVAASCHNHSELQKAEALGLDFAVLSPVCRTPSHSQAVPMGWERFRELVATVNIPVYALGGMNLDCLPKARQNGARGIAGIRGMVLGSLR
ncbi:Nudix family hydrolase [Methyloterricola oryzae]|uniref:Nudix family hydrolase n=1 Tax=Methyloterricola oryzae TaxID=1495050 RepID=UPI0005EAE5AD|nr:Nudix family hydrolase [Methyloterricola oryzae]